jgi:tRNA(Ile)-lysidine synthase
MTARPDAGAGLHVTDAAFAAAMAPFRCDGAAMAVAVSGGPDSMALLRLLHAWSIARGIDLHAVTVDHRLRAAAAVEAAQVASWCEALAIPHVTLAWEEGPAYRAAGRSPQAAARAARYGLMTAWCRSRDIPFLCLAHHADDQAETFLMRLARGSGVDGLAAMAPASMRDGVTLLRPLLDLPKEALIATCRARGQAWIDDPSNENPASARVRFRQARALLATEGFTTARLLAAVRHLRRARDAIDAAVSALMAEACAWDAYGVARMAIAPLREAPAEIGLRALARILVCASGAEHGPRFDSLASLYARLLAGPWRDATLHGCRLVRHDDDGAPHLTVMREARAIGAVAELAPGRRLLWDGRFVLAASASAPGPFRVGPMTAAAWTALADPAVRVPATVRASLPLLSDATGPAIIPIPGFVRADGTLSVAAETISCTFAPPRHVTDLPPFAEM